MDEENEGERSEHRHVVTPRKRRRFSSGEVTDLITALFVLMRYRAGQRVDASLLARALRIEAVTLGTAVVEEEQGENTPEGDDNGT